MKHAAGLKYLSSGVDEFQPGSRDRVLKNKLGIVSARRMDKEEITGYINAERNIIDTFTKDQRLRVDDIHEIHRWFLGDIYAWAGTIRSVNISKGNFTFATAFALPQALRVFEDQILSKHTPCHGDTLEEIAEHIAVVHSELLLLHPYREGNGRTARLVATLMAYQAGLPGIDFGFIGGRGKEFEKYVGAIQEGVKGNYDPMKEIILRALRRAARGSKL